MNTGEDAWSIGRQQTVLGEMLQSFQAGKASYLRSGAREKKRSKFHYFHCDCIVHNIRLI